MRKRLRKKIRLRPDGWIAKTSRLYRHLVAAFPPPPHQQILITEVDGVTERYVRLSPTKLARLV